MRESHSHTHTEARAHAHTHATNIESNRALLKRSANRALAMGATETARYASIVHVKEQRNCETNHSRPS